MGRPADAGAGGDPRALRAEPAARQLPRLGLPARDDGDGEPADAQGGGADVVLCASNPLSTQDDVAAALVDEYDIAVFAIKGEDNDTYYAHIEAAVDRKPQITMDDSADVIGVLPAAQREQLGDIIAGTEETTTGVIRLKALERDGALGFLGHRRQRGENQAPLRQQVPGTGQSTIDGIVRATNVLLAKRFVVSGYGWVGKGVAMRAKGLGAHVIVTEVEPLNASRRRWTASRYSRWRRRPRSATSSARPRATRA